MKAIRDGKHGYTPSAGIAELREAIAKYVSRTRGIAVSADDVVVGAGAKPFIAYTILSVTDHGAGDEVIYPNPGFPIYESQIRAMGAVPVPIYLRESRGFNFDPGGAGGEDHAEDEAADPQLAAESDRRHRPEEGHGGHRRDPRASTRTCGCSPTRSTRRLVYDGEFASLASIPGMQERTIICDGASKTWAMTGWRLGYAVNKALAPVFTRWVTNTESCASQISQWAAVEAINGPQDDAERMRDSFLARRDLIVGLLNKVPGVTCQSPGGAFYAWPNVTAGVRA